MVHQSQQLNTNVISNVSFEIKLSARSLYKIFIHGSLLSDGKLIANFLHEMK